MKEQILKHIYNYYINSEDYNGISIGSLNFKEVSGEQILNYIIELINEGKVNIISSKDSLNIHINRIGFLPKNEQINDLMKNVGVYEFCCYPSTLYLEEHINRNDYAMKPFDLLLALGTPQLRLQYFKWDVLDKYSEDPQFDFTFRDYEGEVYSTESLPETEYIHLKTFGTGRDSNDNLVVAVFTRYLTRMSSTNQCYWLSKMVDGEKCKYIKSYWENQINCCFAFPDSIYSVILKEMFNINSIAQYIWGVNFFIKDFSTNQCDAFGTIFKPTLKRYNDFIMVFEKIIPNNINPDFFTKVHNDGKDEKGILKGTINRFRDWLRVICPLHENEITEQVRAIRKVRQSPAHKIEKNIYDYNYFNLQLELSIKTFDSLVLFRQLLLTHPKAKNFIIKHKNEEYIVP